MRLGAVDQVTPSTPIEALPLRLELRGSRGSFLVSLLMTVPVAILLIAPFALIGMVAVSQPTMFASLSMSWSTGIQLAIALAIVMGMTGFAVRRVVMSWGRKATVEIGYGVVAVIEGRFGFKTRWTEPLTEFRGIAHNVRATLSGSRHELVLVHPNPDMSVMLQIAQRMPQPHIDRVAILLGLPEIPAQSLMPRMIAAPSAQLTLPTPVQMPSPVTAPVSIHRDQRPKLELVA
jgi:hypothetical protein